ncbi:MAG: hypothetical protein MJZ30_11455 [Paludibacteraceae bacterium]|nr:hypothetical protein [Paludibacteraceae bacterium]
MSKYKNIEDCFDENGDFIIKGFNPYHVGDDPDEKELYDFLFDEDGYAIRDIELVNVIHKNNWNWTCSAVRYYYAANCIDANCGGNYSAVYAWRH